MVLEGYELRINKAIDCMEVVERGSVIFSLPLQVFPAPPLPSITHPFRVFFSSSFLAIQEGVKAHVPS